jgi:hypothetical protein
MSFGYQHTRIENKMGRASSLWILKKDADLETNSDTAHEKLKLTGVKKVSKDSSVHPRI